MASPTLADTALGVDETGKPDQRKSIIRAMIVAWIILFLGVSIPLALFMDSWVGGLTVGFFTALFGGPGFGVMAGFALYNLHLENWEKKHSEAASH